MDVPSFLRVRSILRDRSRSSWEYLACWKAPVRQKDRTDQTRPDRPNQTPKSSRPTNAPALHWQARALLEWLKKTQSLPAYTEGKADKKRACVLFQLRWHQKPTATLPPTTGGRAETLSPGLLTLSRLGAQKAFRAPQSTQKGTGHYVQKNVGPHPQKQKKNRVRAEDLIKPHPPWRYRGIKQEKTTHPHRKNITNGTPTLRCPKQRVPVSWVPEVLRWPRKEHLRKLRPARQKNTA